MSVYSFVFLLCFSLCILYAHSLLLASKRCVPTSVVRKKCMTCICGMDGVYYCKDNCLKKNGTIKEAYSGGGKECDPLRLYRSDRLFCNCDATGQWLSSMCRQKFNSIAAFKAPVKKGPYRESIPCTPKSLYLIDCNVCECGLNGIMDHSSCTDRQCAKASKADKCLYGDVVKTDTELCSCSEVNYYVDRLCIKINSLSVQNIARSALARIIEQHGFIKSAPNKTETCIKHRVYQVDCNQCHCTDHNTLRCSRHECLPETRRFIKNKDFDSLPSLQNRFEDCHPGHKYKFKCNTCICSSKRIPSCTSMVCLEDLVDTKAALRDLPELIEGESCVAGQKYKRDCNICECRSTYELVCSQDVCPSKDNEDPFEETERLASRTTNCTPGEVSNNLKNCEWCYCNVHLEQRCVKKQFVECDDTVLNPRAPVELDPAMISDNETLPVLPYLFSPCRPGNKYQVDCNKCICNDEGNLLCQRNYCFSFNDAHARDAYKMSGTSCRAGEVIFYNCIRCECSKKKMRCNAIPGCRTQSEEILVKSYQAQGMSLDISGSYGARTKECIPNSIYRLDCNKCYCQKDGSLRCTKMTCLNYKQIDGLRKLRNRLEGNADSRDLPVIHPGHPCKEGQVYRSECNTCLCGPKNTLTCTTMACIKGVDYERSSQSNTERKVRTKDVKRQGNTKKCKPGMIEDKLSTCQICYCNFLSQFHCNTLTPQQCKEKKLRLHSATKTVDVNPMFHAAVQDLPTLPDSSSKCEPGRSYQVGCNKCFCSHDGNLLCTLIYCLSFTDVHERDSIKMAGTPCRDGEIVKYNCIECQCKLHLMTCSAVKDCVTYVEENLIAKYKSKGKALDLQPHETHDCIPDVIYRLKCNKCYCQKDRTMRCTTMTCLNWSETESVNKLKGKLEHHGL